ncbi:MAG: 30S ribosomal protein S8 [Chthoniobacteraceae bacterium]
MSQISDPIADFLTRLRNSTRAAQFETSAPYSRIKAEIARILKQEGYISDYVIETSGRFPQIKVTNKYVNQSPAITGLKRVSRPGLRKYIGADEIPRVLGGMGVSILSTPKGVISGRDARKQNIGGELLATIW